MVERAAVADGVAEHFERVFRVTLERCRDLESWPGHFLLKKTETEILVDGLGIAPHRLGLEVGCGNGFQSALLSRFSERLVATDLFAGDFHSTHSVGIARAKTLLARAEVDNVDVIAASATELPFPTGSFDYVISSNALEHIPARMIAVAEIHRVLKPGGRFVVVVPTHVASLCAFPHVPLYVGVRVAQIAWRKWRGRGLSGAAGALAGPDASRHRDTQRRLASSVKAFWRNHPSFPLPEPHGAYPSIFHELISQTPGRWARLLRATNFTIEDSRAIVSIPVNLLEVLSSRWMAGLYAKLRGWHVRWGRAAGVRSWAFAWGAVCRKI